MIYIWWQIYYVHDGLKEIKNHFKTIVNSIQILHNIFSFRRTNRQYPSVNRDQAYKSHGKGCDETQFSERDSMKPTEQVVIPDYIRNWSKDNTPFISSPNLLTGYNGISDMDSSQRLPFRDRSLSAGNKNIQDQDIDPLSATYAVDKKKEYEYKTPILWHELLRTHSNVYASFCHLTFYYDIAWSSAHGFKDTNAIESGIVI